MNNPPNPNTEQLTGLIQRLRDFYTSDETYWRIEHDITVEAADTLESLAAEVARLTTIQPLETAPKDGSHFLMIGTNFDGGAAVVYWDDWWYLDDGKNFEIALRHEAKLIGWLPLPPGISLEELPEPPVARKALSGGAEGV